MTERHEQGTFDGWAIVDVLGHQRYVGYVTTQAFGGAVLFRIDVPALEERTRTTVRPGYLPDGRYAPPATVVTEGAVAGYTKLVGAGSIYTITPCTKDAAIEVLERSQPRPFLRADIPASAALGAPAATVVDGPDVDDDDEEDDEESCENCDRVLTEETGRYRTEDDVLLCGRCYDDLAPAPPPAPTETR